MGEHDWYGIAVGLIGIALAIYFYLRSKRKVEITYSIDQTQLLGGNRGILPDEVSIRYRDVQITNLTKLNVVFWNSGTETITHDAIIESLTLGLPETANLLKASVLKCSQSQNGVALKAANDSQKMHVDFRYLEPRQGFNVELLVAGGIKGDLNPTGIIMGMPAGFRKFDEENRRMIAQWVLFSMLFLAFLAVTYGTTQFPDNMFIKKGRSSHFRGLGSAYSDIWREVVTRYFFKTAGSERSAHVNGRGSFASSYYSDSLSWAWQATGGFAADGSASRTDYVIEYVRTSAQSPPWQCP